MSDSADELILKMQHLEAQARETTAARGLTRGVERLKSAAQKLAWEAQKEILSADQAAVDGEAKIERAKQPGVNPLEAGALLQEGRAAVDGAKHTLIKAHARLNFALDKMSEVDRREYEAFHADVRAETHAQLAEDPLFEKT